MSTPITCSRLDTVVLHACLREPFVNYTVFPNDGVNFGGFRFTGAGNDLQVSEYASYVDDGTNQSFISTLTDPDASVSPGFYTGTKLMMYTLDSGNYYVGYVAHAATDPDDLTGPALTITNVGNGGMAVPAFGGANDGPIRYTLVGRSAAGGDRISWFEGRSTTMHFLTSTTTTLTRQQAFPLSGGETFRDFTARVSGWLHDGENFWLLSSSSGDPHTQYLVRFKPTTVGDPYDYEKFTITFDDTDLNDTAIDVGLAGMSVTDDTFIAILADINYWGGARYLEITKDGTGYTEYVVTGGEAVTAMADDRVPYMTKSPSGAPKLVGYAYESDDPAVGTYDLTCLGSPQAAAYAERIERKAPLTQTITGNRITAGDMQSGTDKRVTSSGDTRIWRDMIDGR